MKTVIIVTLILVGCASLYVGLSGWAKINFDQSLTQKDVVDSKTSESVDYDNINFKNLAALRREREVERIRSFSPWIESLPEPLSFVLASLSFGCLGGVLAAFRKILVQRGAIDLSLLGLAFLSSFNGLLVLGISYVVPAALTANKVEIRPLTLLFLSLFAGLFSDYFFEWADKRVRALFPK